MRYSIALVMLLLSLTACGSTVEDVQATPVALTMKVPATWDSVATCIAQFYMSTNETSYLPVASEQRAKVIVKFVGGGFVPYASILFVFEISGGNPTTVVMRQAQRGALDNQNKTARELIERCGRGENAL